MLVYQRVVLLVCWGIYLIEAAVMNHSEFIQFKGNPNWWF